MFENFKTFETTYAGRPVVVETGKTCGLANGSCWVRYGETVVMANVTASAKPREGVDFFPLSVDFEEKNVCSRQNTRFFHKERRQGF